MFAARTYLHMPSHRYREKRYAGFLLMKNMIYTKKLFEIELSMEIELDFTLFYWLQQVDIQRGSTLHTNSLHALCFAIGNKSSIKVHLI